MWQHSNSAKSLRQPDRVISDLRTLNPVAHWPAILSGLGTPAPREPLSNKLVDNPSILDSSGQWFNYTVCCLCKNDIFENACEAVRNRREFRGALLTHSSYQASHRRLTRCRLRGVAPGAKPVETTSIRLTWTNRVGLHPMPDIAWEDQGSAKPELLAGSLPSGGQTAVRAHEPQLRLAKS